MRFLPSVRLQHYRSGWLFCCLAALSGATAHAAADKAIATELTVRVVSQDAKLIQDSVGGAAIVVRNADTGEVLAEGRQRGDSGSTDKIMRQAHHRGETIYAVPGAAHFATSLDLTRPTRVEISAEGPLDFPQALQSTSTTLLMVPGQDVSGDGVVLTLHGFIVEVLAPGAPAMAMPDTEMKVEARIRMMCGCPTEPGGLWDSDSYTIKAQLLKGNQVVAETALDYAGRSSIFNGQIGVPGAGAERLRVVASDPAGVNFGMVEVQLASSMTHTPALPIDAPT